MPDLSDDDFDLIDLTHITNSIIRNQFIFFFYYYFVERRGTFIAASVVKLWILIIIRNRSKRLRLSRRIRKILVGHCINQNHTRIVPDFLGR